MRVETERLTAGLRAAERMATCRGGIIGLGSAPVAVGARGMLANVGSIGSEDDVERFARDAAVDHALMSERDGPGSALACIRFAIAELAGTGAGSSRFEGRAMSSDDVVPLLSGVLAGADLEAAIAIVGASGATRYLVERSSRGDSVEWTDCYEFVHGSRAVDAPVDMDGALALVADGYVESASELQGLFEECSAAGNRLLMCCRGFSDDVMHTLAVNRGRGTLAAYGLVFPHDEKDANTLADVATVVGTDVVSSLKGQLFTTIRASDLRRVSKVRLRGQSLEIRQPDTRAAVELRAADLRARAAEETEKFVSELLLGRARKLSGRTTIVRLADSIGYHRRSEAWDLALRTIRSATRGVVAVSSDDWPGRSVVPLESVASAARFGRALARSLSSSAHLIR